MGGEDMEGECGVVNKNRRNRVGKLKVVVASSLVVDENRRN
jgi:hypothetical protein